MIRASIGRPIAVAMTYLAIALLGIAAWRDLPIELLPDTRLPQLTLSARWPGASPEAMEALLTSPLEAAVQQVRGVERIRSLSMEGQASISIEFGRTVDMDFARLELSERLGALEGSLPLTSLPPVVTPYVPPEFEEQTRPFLEYTVTGPYTTEGLRAQVDSLLVEQLEQLDGVAQVHVDGGRARLLEIELDELRIGALGLSLSAVRQRLQNIEYVRETGVVDVGGRLHTLAIRHRLDSLDELLRLPVLSDGGRIVRLADFATIRDGYEEPRAHYRIDGRPAITFQVTRQSGTNAVRVADRVKEQVAALEQEMAPGTRLLLDQDESDAIRAQFSEMRSRALFSVVVIFLVLLFFLRSLRSTAIVFATIAFAALITLNAIYWSGMSLNVLTLAGLAMGFGMVVDNAIVVLENVYRRFRAGEDAMGAAERGTREVVLPILAATMTTLVVLVPFVYLQGELRLFYVPLGVVVALSLLASVFVAFTFTPALAGRLLAAGEVSKPGGAARSAREPLYTRIYQALTGVTLRFPWTTVLLATAILAGSWYLFDQKVARGVIWNPYRQFENLVEVRLTLPRGEELARVDELARFFEGRLGEMSGVGCFVTRIQGESATIRVTFPDSVQQTGTPLRVQEELTSYGYNFGGAQISIFGIGPAFNAGSIGGPPPNYRIRIFGYNYETVRSIAEEMARRLTTFSRIREVNTNVAGQGFPRDRVTELVLEPDRNRLALHGLSSRDLVAQVGAAIAGTDGRASTLRLDGEPVSFALKLAGHELMDLLALEEVLIQGEAGEGVRLSELARVHEREVLSRVVRENQQYERSIGYEFLGPVRLGNVVRDAVVETTHLPPGYRIEATSDFQLSSDDQRQIYAVLALALVLVFMLTAALFESIRQPLCILLTVPMALVGVFLLFYATGASFTREAYIGVVMMAGIVVNNAILLVDHINRVRKDRTLPLRAAILRGTLERTRPILMTSATTILGMLPLVLFTPDADARIWNALGYTLIGGMTSSMLFVLTVTPALYLLFERGRDSSHQLARIAAVLLMFTLAGGCTGGSVEERSTLSESVITEIMPSGKLSVTTLRPAVPAGTWRLANVPAVQIGLADGNPAYLFQRVIHAHSLPDGRIVVLDAGAGEIRSFDRGGRHIRSTSRPGPGPGELQNPLSVQRLSGDSMLVAEFDGRISLFDENGDFVEQLAVGARRPSYRIDAETFLYVYRQDPIPNPPGQLRLTQTIVLGTQQGPGSDTLAVLLGDEFVVAPGGRSSVQLPLTAGTYHVIDLSGRLVATTGDHTLAFHAIGTGDDIEARIERNPPAISDAEWRRAVEEVLLRTEDSSGRVPPEFVAARSRSVREMLASAQKPASLPGFDRLVASRDGGVWAREYKLDPELTESYEWFIFAEDGRWITSVHIPARLTLQEVSSEHILAVAEDELGVQHIELYPIIRDAVD